jgi:hypothetical protein
MRSADFGTDIPGMSYEQFPVVVYTGPVKVTDAEMQGVLDAMKALRDQQRAYAMVLDVQKTEGLTPTQRRMITSGVEGDEEREKKYYRGMALVFESPMLKRILTAIFWIKRPVVPFKVFTDTNAAIQWAQGQMNVEAEKTRPTPPHA